MLLYILICLSLSLAGVAGLQLMYMMYLDRIDKERKKRVHELEIRCRNLAGRLAEAEELLADQRRMIELVSPENDDEEVWADVIEER